MPAKSKNFEIKPSGELGCERRAQSVIRLQLCPGPRWRETPAEPTQPSCDRDRRADAAGTGAEGRERVVPTPASSRRS